MIKNISMEKPLNRVSKYLIAKKIYYHGRNEGKRPYKGNYIFITDSIEYATIYSDEKTIYKYSIPFSMNKIFSIKNKAHRQLLSKQVDDEVIQAIIRDSGPNQEIDWGALSYINSDDFDYEEDLLRHLGFLGVKLKERPGIDSIYIFNQNDLKSEGVTTPMFGKTSSKEVIVYKGEQAGGEKRFVGTHFSTDKNFSKMFGDVKTYKLKLKNVLDLSKEANIKKLFNDDMVRYFKAGDFWKVQTDKDGFNFTPINEVVHFAKQHNYLIIKYVESFSSNVKPINYLVLSDSLYKEVDNG